MTNMTLALPDELTKKMKEFPEIRWSEVARRAIEKRVSDLEIMNRIASIARDLNLSSNHLVLSNIATVFFEEFLKSVAIKVNLLKKT